MTHAEHFLERLDRLSARHTEEALLLYNDPPLLRSLLELARVPERVERVALALDEGGPYVLITRAGRFVTCLAAGMKVDDVPIISRQQLDQFTEKVGELRARMELARSLTGTSQGGTPKLIGRLTSAGADLSREEFAAIVLWRPMLVYDLLRCLFGAVNFMNQMRDLLARTRRSKSSREVERVLHHYWDAYWAVGHLSMMLSTGGAEMFESLPEKVSMEIRPMLAWGTMRQGGVGLALRGAWSVARLGKTMLPTARQRLREAQSLAQHLTGFLPLLALAVRHSSLRAQVLKELAAELPDTANRDLAAFHQALYKETIVLLENPESVQEMTRAYAECSLEARRQVRGRSPIALPDARRLPVVCLDVQNFHTNVKSMSYLPALLIQVARSTAEDLYLPRADMDTFGYGPWIPGYTQALLKPIPTERPTPPAKAPETVGRNDPCACGSGKKFKKCCG